MIPSLQSHDGAKFSAHDNIHLPPSSQPQRSHDMIFLLCTSGSATIEVDTRTYDILPRTQVILTFDSISRIISSSHDFRCSTISMSPDFMENMGTRLDLDLIKFLEFNPVSHHTDEYDSIISHVFQLACAIAQRPNDQRQAQKMHALLHLYLADIADNSSAHWADTPSNRSSRQTDLFTLFLKLVRENITSHRDVNFYAAKLSITPRYLSQICRQRQLTPKKVIDESLCFTAKELLYATNLSVQDIATQLNFDDQSLFTRFFHRVTTLTPSQWRAKHKN